ncbi:MAG: hypothetical protein LC540_16255 [Candidatus Thiodiazotropha sp.]|nr:hypothetical protein [Candidatus Thiodiazotropha sp.]
MSIDPDKVFAQVEADRASGKLSEKVTSATISYQGTNCPDLIEQINRETGQKILVKLADGVFTPFNDDV